MLWSGQPMRTLFDLQYYCHSGLCLWSVAIARNWLENHAHAPADSEEQGYNFCYDIGDCQCTVGNEGHERFL